MPLRRLSSLDRLFTATCHFKITCAILISAFVAPSCRALVRPATLPWNRFAFSVSVARTSSSILSQNLFAASKAINRSFTSTTSLAAKSTMIQNTEVRHVPDEFLPSWMKAERTRCLNSNTLQTTDKKKQDQCIVYWMYRDVRAVDNWALLLAASLAQQHDLPLRVVYALPPPPASSDDDTNDDNNLPPTLQQLPITERYGMFLLGGLEKVHQALEKHNVPLHVLTPENYDSVGASVASFAQNQQAAAIITDFSPLRHAREWMEVQCAAALKKDKSATPLWQVDAHNIVPVWEAGEGKRQVGARTLRPRIHKRLGEYLTPFPSMEDIMSNAKVQAACKESSWPAFIKKDYQTFMQLDTSVPSVDWAEPGTEAGMKQFELFCRNGLKDYDSLRNDPTRQHICSNLSPWINMGHVSFQSVSLAAKKLNKYATGTAGFLEEGIIRRELSDNFLYYTPNDYDALTAAAEWAQETLRIHATDQREYVYTLKQFEDAETHDDLWNAAQLQVVREGQMHGFMRVRTALVESDGTVNQIIGESMPISPLFDFPDVLGQENPRMVSLSIVCLTSCSVLE